MATLTDDELAEIQEFVDLTAEQLSFLGLEIGVDDDLTNWAQFLNTMPATHGVTTTHDPELSYVHPGNSFWIYFQDKAGDIFACGAHKVVDTDDFIDEVRTHRIFFGRRPILQHYPVGLISDSDLPEISGRVGLGGGLWVHPDRRKRVRGISLSGLMSPLTRALSLRHFMIDWFTGFMLNTANRQKLGTGGFGISHTTALLSGTYPPHGMHRDIQLLYMDRTEIMEQIVVANQSFREVGSYSRRQA